MDTAIYMGETTKKILKYIKNNGHASGNELDSTTSQSAQGEQDTIKKNKGWRRLTFNDYCSIVEA